MAISQIKNNNSQYITQSGKATTDSNGSATVAYPKVFAEVPAIAVTSDAWNPSAGSVAGVGQTYFTLRGSANTAYHWLAYGKIGGGFLNFLKAFFKKCEVLAYE